jgi:hypothetical protein
MDTLSFFPQTQKRAVVEALQTSLLAAGPTVEIHEETTNSTVKLQGLALSNAWITSVADLLFVVSTLKASLGLNVNGTDAIAVANIIDKSISILQAWIVGDVIPEMPTSTSSLVGVHKNLTVNQPFILQDDMKLLDWTIREFIGQTIGLLTLKYQDLTLKPVYDSRLEIVIEPATNGYPATSPVQPATIVTLYTHLVKRLLGLMSNIFRHPILPHMFSKETWSTFINVLTRSTLWNLPEFEQLHAQVFGLLLIVVVMSNIGQLNNNLLDEFPTQSVCQDSAIHPDSKTLWQNIEALFQKVTNKSSHLIQFNNTILPLTNHLVHLLHQSTSQLVILDPVTSKPINMEVGGERLPPTFVQVNVPKPSYAAQNPLVKTASEPSMVPRKFLSHGPFKEVKQRLLLITNIWWKLLNLLNVDTLEPNALVLVMTTLSNLVDILSTRQVNSNTVLDIAGRWIFKATTLRLDQYEYEAGRSLALGTLFRILTNSTPPISPSYISSFQSILSNILQQGDAGVMSQAVENLRVLFTGVKGYRWAYLWPHLTPILPTVLSGLHRCVPQNQLLHEGVDRLSVYSLLVTLFSVPCPNPVWNIPNSNLSRAILMAMDGRADSRAYIANLLLSSLAVEKEPNHQTFLLRAAFEISCQEVALKPTVVRTCLEKILASVVHPNGWTEEVVLCAFDCLIQTTSPQVLEDVISHCVRYLDLVLGRKQAIEPGNASHLVSLVPYKNIAPRAYEVLAHWISLGPIPPVLFTGLSSTLARGIGLLEDGEFGKVETALDAKNIAGPLCSSVGGVGCTIIIQPAGGRTRSASVPMKSPVKETPILTRAKTPDLDEISAPPSIAPHTSSSTLDKLQKITDGFVQGLTDATGAVVYAPLQLGKALRKTTGSVKRGQSGVQLLANSISDGTVVTGSGVNPVGPKVESTQPLGIPSFAIQQVALMIKISAEVALSRLLIKESVYGVQRLSTLYTDLDDLTGTKFFSVDARCLISLKQVDNGVVMVMRDATSRYSWTAHVSTPLPKLPEKDNRRRVITISEGTLPAKPMMSLPSPKRQAVSVKPRAPPYQPDADVVHVEGFNDSALPSMDQVSPEVAQQLQQIQKRIQTRLPVLNDPMPPTSLPKPKSNQDQVRLLATQLGEWSLANQVRNRWIPLSQSETLVKDLQKLDDFTMERECIGVGLLYSPNYEKVEQGWEALENFVVNKTMSNDFWSFLSELAVSLDAATHVGWMGGISPGQQDDILYWSDEWYQMVFHLPQLLKPMKPSVTAVGPLEADFPIRESSLADTKNQHLLSSFKTMVTDDLVWLLWIDDGLEDMLSALSHVSGPTVFILVSPIDKMDPLGLYAVKTLFVNPLYQLQKIYLPTAPTRSLVAEGSVDPTSISVAQLPFGPLLASNLVPRSSLATLVRSTLQSAHTHLGMQFRQGNCGIFGQSKPVKRPYFQRRHEIEEITKRHRTVFSNTGGYFASAFS